VPVLATDAVETLDLKFEVSDLTWLQVVGVGPVPEGLFRAGTIEFVRRHDFIGIEIAIGIVVIEAPLSMHTEWNNSGPYGLSTTRRASVRPLDPDSDPDSDFDATENVGLE
jgi:hypothetical protein